jgi:hypothetical protein
MRSAELSTIRRHGSPCSAGRWKAGVMADRGKNGNGYRSESAPGFFGIGARSQTVGGHMSSSENRCPPSGHARRQASSGTCAKRDRIWWRHKRPRCDGGRCRKCGHCRRFRTTSAPAPSPSAGLRILPPARPWRSWRCHPSRAQAVLFQAPGAPFHGRESAM